MMVVNFDFSEEKIKQLKDDFLKDVKRGPFYKQKIIYFDISNPELFRGAVWQGYLDANRTFAGIGCKKTNPKGKPFSDLADSIHSYFTDETSQFNHDKWCKNFIDNIKQTYSYDARYGQAQKVVNMAFKYLYCCEGADKYADKFRPCHMPFDQYTLLWLSLEKDVFYQDWSWFSEPLYNEAQSEVRSVLRDNIIGKEFVIWDKYRNIKTVDLEKEYKKEN